MDPSQAPEVVQQQNGHYSDERAYNHATNSSQQYLSQISQTVDYKHDSKEVPDPKLRVCGLSAGRFWAVIILLVVIVAAALGGGIGGGLAAKSHSMSSGSR
jgi:hypothetical protein